MNSNDQAEVAARLKALPSMEYHALRDEWRRLYRAPPPPRVYRALLELGIAWKIQERAYGGLGATTRRKLADLAKTLDQDGDLVPKRQRALRPGARLIREWHGTTHTILVVDDGFEWQGKTWRSLSAIARAITGVRWSGPRFFGLSQQHKADRSNREGDDG